MFNIIIFNHRVIESETELKEVREMRRKLIAHMIQLRNEHSQDRTYKCYLKYDKLFANGTLYRLNVDDDSLVPEDG